MSRLPMLRNMYFRTCICAMTATALLHTTNTGVQSQELHSNPVPTPHPMSNLPRKLGKFQAAMLYNRQKDEENGHHSVQLPKVPNQSRNSLRSTKVNRMGRKIIDLVTSDAHILADQCRPLQRKIETEKVTPNVIIQRSKHQKQTRLIRSRRNMLTSETTGWQLNHRKYQLLNDNRAEIISKTYTGQTLKSSTKTSLPGYCDVLCKCYICNDRLFTDCSRRYITRLLFPIDNATFYLNFSSNFMQLIAYDVFSGLPNLNLLDLSYNNLLNLRSKCFASLYMLTYLNLSNSHVETVDGNIFKALKSLRDLDMRNNFLDYTLGYSNRLEFSSLPKVEVINLSANRLSSLKLDTFINNRNLKILDLSDNFLAEFDLDLRNNRDLIFLNLSENRLSKLGQNAIDALTSTADHHEVSVDLSFNPLSCNCQTIPFLKWLFETNIVFTNGDNYTCTFNNGTTTKLHAHLTSRLDQECNTYIAIIMSCTIAISFFLVSVFSVIAYRYRWYIMYMYYMSKVRKSDEEESDGEFTWDAFPSFADNDAKFVGTDMRENLEEEHGIWLHIRHRDYPLAEVNAVNISNAVRMSRKTVLVLSRHFFRNKWCNFELNMARVEGIYTERQVIILIFVEDIPETFLTQQVVELLRECPVLDLPKDNSVKDAFWKQLADYIRK